MILHDSAEFKRSFHIAKFFVAIFFAMLGICFETTKFFQKNEKKNRDFFARWPTQVPDLFLFSREKSLHSLPFPVEN